MKFLITGGAGFIGSNLMHYEVKNYPDDYFVCIDALTYAGNYNNIKDLESFDNFKFVRGDITDRDLIYKLFEEEKFDYVINLAAESHVDNSIKNPTIFLTTTSAPRERCTLHCPGASCQNYAPNRSASSACLFHCRKYQG